MRSHMPRKYWRNLPEAELIGDLIARAPGAMQVMIANAPTEPPLRAPRRPLLASPGKEHTQETKGLWHLLRLPEAQQAEE